MVEKYLNMKLQLFLVCLSMSVLLGIRGEPITVKLDSQQIVNFVGDVIDSRYFKSITDDIVNRVVDHITKQQPKIKYRNNGTDYKSLLNDVEVIELINEPSPDGDNLYMEQTQLSDQEADEARIPYTDHKKHKINGRYYRKLFSKI